MSRFAKIQSEDEKAVDGIGDNYKLGHHDDVDYEFKSKKGLTESVVRDISKRKDEPEWMLEIRLKALEKYYQMKIPKWGGDIEQIDFENIHYYLQPKGKQERSWEDVPDAIKKTFEKIGVPEAEKGMLAGVKAQYDSEVIYGSLRKNLEDKGVIFLGMDEGLKRYPDLVKEYFGKIIPMGDNKLAALNTAVWSGGSFLYIPKGVEVGMPLQTYFRINSENAGQFERTLIIADEGSKVHYVEGCFTAGAKIETIDGRKNIEDVKKGDEVITHMGRLKKVNYLQKRRYSGNLYNIKYFGDSTEMLEVTDEHPILCVRRKRIRDKNKRWTKVWLKPNELKKHDYLVFPIEKETRNFKSHRFEVKEWAGKKIGFVNKKVTVPLTQDFLRLVGYYLAEGSISSGSYLNFSFAEEEREYIDDVKNLVQKVFGLSKSHESRHKKNHGTSVVFSSVELCRIFETFGRKSYLKKIPGWMLTVNRSIQGELIKGWFCGDGNYYSRSHSSGYKEIFRINSTSEVLVRSARKILARLGIASFMNSRDRSKSSRRTMYTLGISGDQMKKFGAVVGINVPGEMNGKRRASMFGIDGDYMYLPIKSIDKRSVERVDVYNFGVDGDESYVANGVAVHNCSAPAYSSGSLHAAVVEIFVKKGAKVTYTTVQNWYRNVYNLVTKRAHVGEDAEMRWIDGNLGSRLTMKYPCCVLAGRRARGETLSIAFAGEGQHQDTGAKMIHLAPETTSQIISKSISKSGGRASYRGKIQINKGATGAKSKVVCDALILDTDSRSDTYPTNLIMESSATLEHEATVSKVGEEQLFYLMSRGLPEHEAEAMIVNGFLEPIMKQIPLEYAVEMNRLVELEMEGSVG